ncbi:MAG: DUF362 domain-containing protein [Desulfatirhabdiaceae bacterium]
MNATVSVLKCDTYAPDMLEARLYESLANIGFDLEGFSGKTVVVKPNLLIPAAADRAITTHPEFFRAAVRIIKKYGGKPVLVESPAIHSLERTLKKTDFGKIVEDEGVKVANVKEIRTLVFGNGVKFKNIDISAAYFDADIIVNLPKFKTHGLTYMTAAVKNLFGTIPGLAKSRMHVKLPGADEFCEFLMDLYGGITQGFEKPKTVIHLMDAVVAMEGEGPGTSGTPKPMNAIFASFDAVAIDWAATTASGLDPKKACTVVKGFERGYGVASPSEVILVGAPISSLGIKPLAPSRGSFMSNAVRWPFTSKRFKNLVLDRPMPAEATCTLCYQCMNICPAQAISQSSEAKKIPTYDHYKCIRCYCCMEVCPEAAISKKHGALQWLIRL